jgi:hypothetical protein
MFFFFFFNFFFKIKLIFSTVNDIFEQARTYINENYISFFFNNLEEQIIHIYLLHLDEYNDFFIFYYILRFKFDKLRNKLYLRSS